MYNRAQRVRTCCYTGISNKSGKVFESRVYLKDMKYEGDYDEERWLTTVMSNQRCENISNSKADIRSSYKGVARRFGWEHLFWPQMQSNLPITKFLSQIFCNPHIRRPDRSFSLNYKKQQLFRTLKSWAVVIFQTRKISVLSIKNVLAKC